MTLQLHGTIRRGAFSMAVDLELPASGVTGIIGPSASGKTSLLRTIAGLDSASRVDLRLGDVVWQRADGSGRVPTHARGVAMVFQHDALFDHLSVVGNLRYGARRSGSGPDRWNALVEIFGLGGLLDRNTTSLSGGERQRVAIARALLCNPRVLLMDEPLASLDDASRRDLLTRLEQLIEQFDCAVLYVSHALDEVARLADRLVLIDGGRMIAQGLVADALTDLNLPLACDPDASSVCDVSVTRHDPDDGVVELAFSGGTLVAVHAPLPPGARLRVQIRARDVSLSREPVQHTSILNILPATVDAVRDLGDGRVLVRLCLGEARLLASISRRSARRLSLEVGQELYAQVKSVALLT